MYARLLPLVCFLVIGASFGRGETLSSAGSELEVFLQGAENASPSALSAMSEDLSSLMLSAGFHLKVRENGGPPSAAAEHLVMTALRGTCAPPAVPVKRPPLRGPVPLASSSVVDGKVLPFTWVDCSALSRFLLPAISKRSQRDQNRLYGQAMARLLAHELYHVLAQTEDHTVTGIGKPKFGIADLLAPHLEFESIAMARLHPSGTIASRPVASRPDAPTDDISVGGR